ncbi:MAG: hypothetical protein WBE78_01745 [Candidatus Binataceae bacterium]
MRTDELSWDYIALARALAAQAASLADIHTGGGEVLESLAPLPPYTVALEEWPPNVIEARKRLTPLGVRVLALTEGERFPLGDEAVELVLNRHGGPLGLPEVVRILKPGGRFLTQQVGGDSLADLLEVFGVQPKWPEHSYQNVARSAEACGLKILDIREWQGRTVFTDVGAIVYFLVHTPWAVDGFSVARHRGALEKLQARIDSGQPLSFTATYFLLSARKAR